jgi:hypothetical protein
MRRTVLALLAVAATAPGCAQMSVGLWADSDRGEKSVSAIASIELPAEPTAAKAPKPAVKRVAPKNDDEWDVPVHGKPTPAAAAKTPNAATRTPKQTVAVERPGDPTPPPKVDAQTEAEDAWGPSAKGVSKSAEFAHEAKTYRWIQGRVSFVKLSGARVWKIRFAPLDQVDQYGGTFVLDGKLPAEMKDGDLVRAAGIPATDYADSRPSRYNCRQVAILQKASKSDQ